MPRPTPSPWPKDPVAHSTPGAQPGDGYGRQLDHGRAAAERPALVAAPALPQLPPCLGGGVGDDPPLHDGVEVVLPAELRQRVPIEFEREYVVTVGLVLFAFSTAIAWSYYGLKGWTYLVGESRAADFGFKAVFCVFVVVGCSIQLRAILDFSDALVFFICVPNILGLYILAPTLKHKLNDYNDRLVRGHIRNYRKDLPD